MQFMLIYTETDADFAQRADPAAAPAYWGAWSDYIAAMREAGVIVNGDGLEGPHAATTLRVRDGRRIVEDGPFADSKEKLGGYVVLEAPDLDAALDWAAQAPCAASGAIELRPVLTRSAPGAGA